MKRIIAFVLLALALPVLAACEDADSIPKTTAADREANSLAAGHVAEGMLSWELQGTAERRRVCARAVTSGEHGTAQAFRALHGGTAAEWAPASAWLLGTCRSGGYAA